MSTRAGESLISFTSITHCLDEALPTEECFLLMWFRGVVFPCQGKKTFTELMVPVLVMLMLVCNLNGVRGFSLGLSLCSLFCLPLDELPCLCLTF